MALRVSFAEVYALFYFIYFIFYTSSSIEWGCIRVVFLDIRLRDPGIICNINLAI